MAICYNSIKWTKEFGQKCGGLENFQFCKACMLNFVRHDEILRNSKLQLFIFCLVLSALKSNFFSPHFTLCPSWLNYKTTLSSRHIQSDHQFYPTIIDEKPNSNLIQFGSRATKRWKFQKTFPVKLVFALPRLFIQVVFNKLAKSHPLTFNQFPFFSYLATQKIIPPGVLLT